MTYEWEAPITLRLLRKRAGFGYRYYPNCSASKWLCDFIKRKSLTPIQISNFRLWLGLQIDIEIEGK